LASPGFRADSLGSLWIRGFHLLGFPWIFSSESGLFNGLQALSGQNYFRAPLPEILADIDLSKSRGAAPFSTDGTFRSGMFMQPTLVDILIFSKKLLKAAAIHSEFPGT
jgi:hypothetical protein